MKLYKFFVLFVLSTGFCACTETVVTDSQSFIKIYGDFEEEKAVEMVYHQSLDRYIVLGSTNSVQLKGGLNQGRDFNAVLVYADAEGNISDTLLIGQEQEDIGKSLSITVDGDLLIGLDTEDTVAENEGRIVNSGLEFQKYIQVIKVSSDRSLVLNKTLGFNNDSIPLYGDIQAINTVSDVMEDVSQEILILGSTNIVDFNKESFNVSTDREDILLIKLAADGSHIFTRRYGNNGIDKGIGIVERADGGYLILGTTDREKLGQDPGIGNVTNILLIYINANGDIEETLVEGTDHHDVPTKIVKRSGIDRFVVIGNVTNREPAQNTEVRGFFLNVLSSGELGTIKLISPMQGGYRSTFNSIKENLTGYIVVGSSTNAVNTELNSGEQITLFKLDNAGEQESAPRFFGWTGDDTGNDLILTASNKIIIVGTLDFSGDSKVIGLIKTDIEGNLQ